MQTQLDIRIDAAPEAVWAAIADLEGAPERISGIDRIELLTEGPIGVGTRWRETRTMMGKEAVETMEITAWEPGAHYTVHSDSCGSDFHWTMRVTPEDGGTRLGIEIRSKARTVMAKLLSPLGFLMAGMMKKCVRQDLEDIKASLEGAPQPAGA